MNHPLLDSVTTWEPAKDKHSQVCAPLHPKGLAPSKESKQVGTPSYLEAQSEARGLGVRLGRWPGRSSLPGTGKPLRVFGQRRPGSGVCLKRKLVLVSRRAGILPPGALRMHSEHRKAGTGAEASSSLCSPKQQASCCPTAGRLFSNS